MNAKDQARNSASKSNIILRDNEFYENWDYVHTVIMTSSPSTIPSKWHGWKLKRPAPFRYSKEILKQYIPIPSSRMEEYHFLKESAVLHILYCHFENRQRLRGSMVKRLGHECWSNRYRFEVRHGHLLGMWPRIFLSSFSLSIKWE